VPLLCPSESWNGNGQCKIVKAKGLWISEMSKKSKAHHSRASQALQRQILHEGLDLFFSFFSCKVMRTEQWGKESIQDQCIWLWLLWLHFWTSIYTFGASLRLRHSNILSRDHILSLALALVPIHACSGPWHIHLCIPPWPQNHIRRPILRLCMYRSSYHSCYIVYAAPLPLFRHQNRENLNLIERWQEENKRGRAW